MYLSVARIIIMLSLFKDTFVKGILLILDALNLETQARHGNGLQPYIVDVP